MQHPLTGRWQGYYTQHGQQHPIHLDLLHEGEHLQGTMWDTDTHTSKSVFEVAVESGLPPGTDEQIEQSLRQMFPEVGGGPIRATSELPSQSTIRGRVDGDTVEFLKIYQGQHFVGYEVGTERVGVTIEGHVVHYRGLLDADGLILEGDWWIPQESPTGRPQVRGSFQLRRIVAR